MVMWVSSLVEAFSDDTAAAQAFNDANAVRAIEWEHWGKHDKRWYDTAKQVYYIALLVELVSGIRIIRYTWSTRPVTHGSLTAEC